MQIRTLVLTCLLCLEQTHAVIVFCRCRSVKEFTLVIDQKAHSGPNQDADNELAAERKVFEEELSGLREQPCTKGISRYQLMLP